MRGPGAGPVSQYRYCGGGVIVVDPVVVLVPPLGPVVVRLEEYWPGAVLVTLPVVLAVLPLAPVTEPVWVQVPDAQLVEPSVVAVPRRVVTLPSCSIAKAALTLPARAASATVAVRSLFITGPPEPDGLAPWIGAWTKDGPGSLLEFFKNLPVCINL